MQITLTSSLSFFISARSALQKSSGRMRRQRAGGLRRVSRSGCWRGWPWWLGLWSAHSLPRNACEIHSRHPPPTHSVTPQPTHQRSQNEEGPVCPVRTADDVYSFATPPPLPSSPIPFISHSGLKLLTYCETLEKKNSRSHLFTTLKNLWSYRGQTCFSFNHWTSGSFYSFLLWLLFCVFFSTCLHVLVLTNSDFHTFSHSQRKPSLTQPCVI